VSFLPKAISLTGTEVHSRHPQNKAHWQTWGPLVRIWLLCASTSLLPSLCILCPSIYPTPHLCPCFSVPTSILQRSHAGLWPFGDGHMVGRPAHSFSSNSVLWAQAVHNHFTSWARTVGQSGSRFPSKSWETPPPPPHPHASLLLPCVHAK
jgi:hypothetical protein